MPFEVVFVFRVPSSSHHSGCFAQVADKIVAEVEGHCIFISVKPPEDIRPIKTILNRQWKTDNFISSGYGNTLREGEKSSSPTRKSISIDGNEVRKEIRSNTVGNNQADLTPQKAQSNLSKPANALQEIDSYWITSSLSSLL